MSELQGFPIVSQLDGSENEQFDCIAACVCAGLRYYNPGQAFSTDAIKDAVYYNGFTGPTEIYKYVDYCERNGVQLYPVYGSDLALLAHTALANNEAILVTEQDDYAPPQYRDSWTHVCVFHKDRPGYLTAMDPYIGKDIEYSDSQWKQRMRSDCVWLMRKGDKMALHFVDGWLREAKEYNIDGNSWDRGGINPSHLVVHGTAGGSNGDAVMAYMQSVGVSTNFAISTNGDIWQGVSCNHAAWGNAPLDGPRFNFARASINPNLWTISIEFCKPDTTNQVNITDAQKASGFALISAICDTYSIDKRRGDGNGGIISHADLNSVNRSRCPGTFPWNDLMIYLANGGQHVGIPANWKDNGSILTAPNGIQVVHGFRDYILGNPWDAANIPLEAEHGANPLEMSNPDLGGGTKQRFRLTTLEWTSSRGVFVAWTGQELIALEQKVQSLNQQLASTQNANVQQLQQDLDAANAQLGAIKTALATIQSEIGAVLK